MPTYQSWNPRNKRWVKYTLYEGKFKNKGMQKTKYKGVKVKGSKKG